MTLLLQYVLSGIGAGAIYALLAIGFSIVYKGTRAINFAQGEYVVIAGVIASVLSNHGWPLWLCVVTVAALGVVMGLLTQGIAVWFLGRPDPLTVTIGTVGITVAADAILIMKTHGITYSLPSFSGSVPLHVGGALLSTQTLWNIGIAIAAVVGLAWFFGRTRRGLSLRAAADDSDTAGAYGVSPSSAAMWSFGLAGGLAAIAGAAITPVTLMSSTEGTQLGLIGFAAAMLGGLGSIPGAVVGGVILGVGQSLVGGYVSSTYSDVLSFIVLLVVLFTRPTGLFKQVAVERV